MTVATQRIAIFSVAGGLEQGTFEDRDELRKGLVHTLVPAGLKRQGTLVAGGLERGALEDREELRQELVHREVRL
ncbi:hypothetical protein ZWY2020_001811 [Hordeum vulgare]|nr:hypothetical protein ZWY2020_001811 [Hordeum vulgare]